MDSLPPTLLTCPHCNSVCEATAFFCPNCGKNVREKPLSTGIWTQIGLYLVSVLLPPLFILWTIKYLKSANPKAKQIGLMSLGLTIVAIIITIWMSLTLMQNISKQMSPILDQYQNLGL